MALLSLCGELLIQIQFQLLVHASEELSNLLLEIQVVTYIVMEII